MEAVASIALNLRPPVVASCLSRIALTIASSPAFTGLKAVTFRFVIFDVEAQHVTIFDCMSDGIGV